MVSIGGVWLVIVSLAGGATSFFAGAALVLLRVLAGTLAGLTTSLL